jgi:hypothetical protein
MAIAAIATATATLLITVAIVTVALAATFRRNTTTRDHAHRVLQTLLRTRHKK